MMLTKAVFIEPAIRPATVFTGLTTEPYTATDLIELEMELLEEDFIGPAINFRF